MLGLRADEDLRIYLNRFSRPFRYVYSSQRRQMAAAALAFIVSLAAYAQIVHAQYEATTKPSEIDYFVRVKGTKFVVGPECKPYYISGWNQWEAMEAAGGALELFGASLPPNTTGPKLARRLLKRASSHGLNVMRAWAHPVSKEYALSTSPGQYNEAVLRGLDYLIDEARKHGVRLLLALVDNWQMGGAYTFAQWAGSDVHEDFFYLPEARRLYKAHVKVLLERVNTVNGRAYKDDPTIFAWNLINEPRCFQCGGLLADWVEEMAAWVKSIDPNHLLTVGEEGFYPEDVSQSASNPQGLNSWAFWEGQHFYHDHASPLIDFASIHLWVNNWEEPTEAFARRWLRQHIADAAALKKPLLLEEFGAWGLAEYMTQRDWWYTVIYGIMAEDAKKGGPTAGAMFWQLFEQGQRAPAEEGGNDGGLFGVFDTDSTFKIIDNFTATMQRLSSSQVWAADACKSALLAPPVPDCSFRRVNGEEGTGLENSSCETDINECARGTDVCGTNAACVNTFGGYHCACFAGYSGDGRHCAPSPRLDAILRGFASQGPGKVACSEGNDVIYPQNAPGYAYDLMGALDRKISSAWKGGFGSRTAVEPKDCMLACASVLGCDSFAYSSDQKRCFLKAGASKTVCEKPITMCVSARGDSYPCGSWQTYFYSNVNASRKYIEAYRNVQTFSEPQQ